jgi:hypothetical protein
MKNSGFAGAATSFAMATAVLVACGAQLSPVIEASSFDQTCTKDTDCVAVLEGDLSCCGGDCGAIRKTANAEYEADLTAITNSFDCSGVECPDLDCSFFPVTCTKGKCAVARCAQDGEDACNLKQP